MKTKFFSTFGPNNERTEFLTDFVFLATLGVARIQKFFTFVPELLKLPETEPTAGRLAADLGIEIYQAENLIRWTKYVFNYRQRRLAPEDTPDDWARDLVTLIGEQKSEAQLDLDMAGKLALEAATLIFKAAEDLRPQYLAQRFARGILPKFDNISSTVELRGIIDNGFTDSAERQPDLLVENYNPRIIDVVEVASVHISTDTDDHYYFQMTEEDLRSAIRSLTATLHELRALRDSVSLGKTG